MARLVVIGGGIAGLATAWSAAEAARRAGVRLDVMVLERSPEVGGKAKSFAQDGWLVEGGPSGFLGGRPEFDALVAGAGMAGEVVGAREAAKHRFVYRAGKMREIRPSPVALARAGILSVGGVMRLAMEPFVARKAANGDDESVWEFAARRLGRQAADRMVSPMCLGIYAGDARRLSLASAFPKMAALERDHGGLIRGMIAKKGKMSSGALSSFRHGMQSLPRALAERGGFTVRCNTEVRAIARIGDHWTVSLADGAVTADAVVIAAEPWAAATLVAPLHGQAGDALGAIPCPAVSVVALGFGPEARAKIPDGFGVLITRGEGIRMLGNLWETSLYPGRGPEGGILVRAMFGGAVDPGIGSLSDVALLDLALDEVRRLYGFKATPRFSKVVRVPRAIPQYELHHAARVRAVEAAEAALPGLALTGFGLRGVAFADAASDGVRTGLRIAAQLGSEWPRPATRTLI